MKILLLVLFYSSHVLAEQFDDEEGVYALTDEVFDDFMDKHKLVFIYFYAPWCKFSQRLKPNFERVASDLKNVQSNIVLAKVDATTEKNLSERFNITEYPVIFLFKENRTITYNGGNYHGQMKNWIISKTSNLLVNIDSMDHLLDVKQKYDTLVVVDELAIPLNELKLIAEDIDDIQFSTMKHDMFVGKISRSSQIIMYRKSDGAELPFDDILTRENIKKFAMLNELPLVAKYSPELGGKLFANPFKTMHFLVFLAKNFTEAHEELAKTAINHKEISFVTVDINEKISQNLKDFFKVEISSVPYLLLSNVKTKALYKPEKQEINHVAINQFLNGVKNGTVMDYLRSQPLTENWDSEPVKELVGDNFEEVAYDKNKSVFVEFYAPWCAYCKQLAPIWENLARSLLHVEHLVIAKMDATQNDVRGFKITSFPVLKLFLKDTNEVVDYKGSRTKEKLKDFLSKYVQINEKKSEL